MLDVKCKVFNSDVSCSFCGKGLTNICISDTNYVSGIIEVCNRLSLLIMWDVSSFVTKFMSARITSTSENGQ